MMLYRAMKLYQLELEVQAPPHLTGVPNCGTGFSIVLKDLQLEYVESADLGVGLPLVLGSSTFGESNEKEWKEWYVSIEVKLNKLNQRIVYIFLKVYHNIKSA